MTPFRVFFASALNRAVASRNAQRRTADRTRNAHGRSDEARTGTTRRASPANPTRAKPAWKGDAEIRELAQLTERANVGAILSATFEKRQTSGEAAELQQHYGIGSHQIPLEMLRVNRSS